MSTDFRRRYLRFREKLVLPKSVLVLMAWCRQNGYRFEVGFGKNRLPEVTIQKSPKLNKNE